ncbi:hypothetical protein T4E_1008 [Trichinella pseudospiralis]|uniref:Uncharacterized protein n=1 Tax=Trichinella pseudospiralis TaxID=6337 RepID=A0A0V0Y8D7_TRIPS|nr:hypothetical protein T4E_1008 [Trichinella pseudospiralis]
MINETGVKKQFISSSNCSNGVVQSGVISNCEQKENCTKQVLLCAITGRQQQQQQQALKSAHEKKLKSAVVVFPFCNVNECGLKQQQQQQQNKPEQFTPGMTRLQSTNFGQVFTDTAGKPGHWRATYW